MAYYPFGKISPCPFCGKVPQKTQRIDQPRSWWKRIRRGKRKGEKELVFRVYCNHCWAMGPRRGTELSAVRAWNLRRQRMGC